MSSKHSAPSGPLAVLAQLHVGHTSRFESDDLWDAEFLRHLGLLKVSGRPVIDGYYAFRR